MQLWVASLAVYFATHEIMRFMITYISCLRFGIFLVFYPCSALILWAAAQDFPLPPFFEGVRSSR
jgi:hypothetical protein